MGDQSDKQTEDWLKDVTFPRGKQSSGEALLNEFGHPSVDNFLKLLDVTTVDQVENSLKRLFGLAINQTKKDVELRVSDPTMQAAAIDDLTRMDQEMRTKTDFTFKNIFSIGDLAKLTQPLPDNVLKTALQKKDKDNRDETATMEGPQPQMTIDTTYRFFERPRFTLQLGGVEKAVAKADPKDLTLNKVGLSWRIAEVKSTEKQASAIGKTPEPQGGGKEEPTGGAKDLTINPIPELVQKSDLEIGLFGNNLWSGKGGNKPALEMNLDYKLQIGNRAVLELGTDDSFGHGIRDLKLTFGFKVDF